MMGAMSLLKVGALWTANGNAPSNVVVNNSQKLDRFFTAVKSDRGGMVGLGWIGWTGLDWVGLGWTGLEKVRLVGRVGRAGGTGIAVFTVRKKCKKVK